MNPTTWRAFVAGGAGLGAAEISALCETFEHRLPKEYLALLAVANGLAFGDGLVIYGAQEVQEMNLLISLPQLLPGYVTIGNDSGGREVVTPLYGGKVFWLDQGYVAEDGLYEFEDSLSGWVEQGLPLRRGHSA